MTPTPTLTSAHTVTPAAAAFPTTGVLVSTSIAGVALLALGAWMLWRKKSRRIVSWMWFVAGFFLSGGLAASVASIFGQVGGAGAHMFGIGVQVFMAIAGWILTLELWHHIRPHKGGSKGKGGGRLAITSGETGTKTDVHRISPYLALATPILVIAGGGGLLFNIYAGVSSMLGHVSGPISALFGG